MTKIDKETTLETTILKLPHLTECLVSTNVQLCHLKIIANKLGLKKASSVLVKLIDTPRRGRSQANKPNRNSTTGIQGIQAFYLQQDAAEKILHFSATWREINDNEISIPKSAQFSSKIYGIRGALDKALKARADATGQKMPSLSNAWHMISELLEIEGAIPVRKRK